MLVPLPAEAPLAPVCVTVQEKVAPATLLVNGMEVVVPEQIVVAAGLAVTLGIGLTVTVIPGIVEVQPAGVVTVTL